MQKLKNRVLDKMLQAHLTKAEVDFILELSHFQDDFGKIYGVYYKSVCEAIGVSYQTFYVTMLSLVDKGLISLDKAFYGDWDITIRDNDFSYQEALKEGYINTGHDIFYNKHFKQLKANEKLLAMQFLKICGAGKNYHISVDNFYEKYAKLLQVTKRTLQVYINKLKVFFSIGIKNSMYWITPRVAAFKSNAPSDLQNFSKHLGGVACRRNRATYTQESLKDTIDLIRQYGETLGIKIARAFLNAVDDSIRKVNAGISNKSKWDRQLRPKFIHKIIRKELQAY